MLEKLRIYVKLAFNLTPFNQINSEWNTERTRGSVGCVWLFAAPWTADRQAPLSSTMFHNLLRFETTESVMLSNHLILCCPLLLLPSIFPSVRVFSNELALHIRWPKYWRFSFSIRTSKEYSGLISFRIDWVDLLEAEGTLRVFSSTTVWKHQFSSPQSSLWSNSPVHPWLLERSQLWLYEPLSAKWCLCF